jgi:hypothetical protein
MDSNGIHITSIHDADNGEANARLIAAAPEMLEALESVDAWIGETAAVLGCEDLAEQVRAALAKVRGES